MAIGFLEEEKVRECRIPCLLFEAISICSTVDVACIFPREEGAQPL